MRPGPETPAVVSGGASGLGAATARALARRGARVAILDLDADRGAAVAGEVHGLYCATDVTDPASVGRGAGPRRGGARSGADRRRLRRASPRRRAASTATGSRTTPGSSRG